MKNTFVFLIAIVFLVLALNFLMLFIRLRKERRPGRNKKAALEEKDAVIWRNKEIQRMLDYEQETAEREVELRNRTLELYEQVRRNAAVEEVSGLDSELGPKNSDTGSGNTEGNDL